MADAKEEWHQLKIKVYSEVIENLSIRLNCLLSLQITPFTIKHIEIHAFINI